MHQNLSTTAPIRVLVVDDHPLLRQGIASVLARELDVELVAEASNGLEAIEAFAQHRPDVTLMDVQMPQMDGVTAINAIRARWPDARIVVLTTYKGDAQALRALRSGASGYLLKSMIVEELIRAIRVVRAGGRHIPNEVAEELAAHVTDDALSARELEVLKRVAAGNSNQKVAALLGVSEETVKAHMKNIMSKLAANDRTHAVTIALKRGIIEV
jgi:DNA-binding NarL/FixJ family response regulator